jgi:hypothetical protein
VTVLSPGPPYKGTVKRAAVALAVALAACSASPKSPPSGQADSGLADLIAYAQCMRSHGIHDFPDPTPNPGGQGGSFSIRAGPGSDLDNNSPVYAAADRTCSKLLPEDQQTPAQIAARTAGEVKIAVCMRAHGIFNWPDPDGQGAFELHNVDMTSPSIHQALETCRTSTGFTGPMAVDDTNGP